MDVALECGITHFDLARSYGFGEAENFVGRALKSRRQHIVIASKFGIAANWKSVIFRPVKPLVRVVRGKRKGHSVRSTQDASAPVSSPGGDRFHDRRPLNGTEMRFSLERSLRALDSEYLDFFFIHEPLVSLEHIDELCATAESLKADGKIRAWGLAYMRTQQDLHRLYLDRFDILQFNNSPGAQGYEESVAARGLMPNVLFSPLNGGRADMTPADKLSRLFNDFPRSVVLCSMYSERHLRENAKLAA